MGGYHSCIRIIRTLSWRHARRACEWGWSARLKRRMPSQEDFISTGILHDEGAEQENNHGSKAVQDL